MASGLPTITDTEVKEIVDFIQLIAEHPTKVIISPRLHAQHVTTMFLIIEHMKRLTLDVACQTQDFRTFDQMCLYLESVGF